MQVSSDSYRVGGANMCLDILSEGFLPLPRLQQSPMREGRVQATAGGRFRKLRCRQASPSLSSVPVLRGEELRNLGL